MVMKGLATEQLILLALGIVVLAVIGYLLYSQFVKGSTSLGASDCQTSIISACNKCKTCVVGFGGTWSGPCPECGAAISANCDPSCGAPLCAKKCNPRTQSSGSGGCGTLTAGGRTYYWEYYQASQSVPPGTPPSRPNGACQPPAGCEVPLNQYGLLTTTACASLGIS